MKSSSRKWVAVSICLVGVIVVVALLKRTDLPFISDSYNTRSQVNEQRTADKVKESTVEVSAAATNGLRSTGNAPNPMISDISSWIALQRAPNLRGRTLQAMQSNDLGEASAALYAILYCSNTISLNTEPPEEAAKRSMLRFPGDESMIRSSVELRAKRISILREQCSYQNDELKQLDRQLRSKLSSTLTPVNNLMSAIRALPSSDLSALSPEHRSLLESGNLMITSLAADAMLGLLSKHSLVVGENDLAPIFAIQLAMCKMGDFCTSESFRANQICIDFGACDGESVSDAIRTFLRNQPDTLLRADKLADVVVAQLKRPGS